MKTQIENLYLYIGKKIEQIEGKTASIDKRTSSNQAVLKETTKDIGNLHKELNSIKKEMTGIKKNIAMNRQQIETQIKNNEDIIMDMIRKFNEKLLNETQNINAKLEELKNQQDVLNISFTFNEKKLLEQITPPLVTLLALAVLSIKGQLLHVSITLE